MAGATTTSEEVVQVVVFPKLKGFWSRNVSMLIAFLLVIGSMTAGGAFVYFKTATKTECHTRHILGIIPDGRACSSVPRY